jgi:hypothetical protein
MIARRRTFVTACRLGQNADPALARVAFEQAEMRMFRRRTGHERPPFRPRVKESTTVLLRSADVGL